MRDDAKKEPLKPSAKRVKSKAMNDRFLEDLKTRVDIVEIIGKYTEIKKRGKNFMARSPFRNERTPSFSISPEKGVWYDFGSSEGGDAISFLEKVENISFQESVEMLADIAGVQVPKNFGEEKVSKEEKKDIFALHRKAAQFFVDNLQKHKPTQEYLKSRSISEKTIKDWQIGYGGDESNGLSKFLRKEGFSEDSIAQSGVAFEREFGDKKMRDRFFERLMIPICEPRNGEIIAFGGRDLSGKKGVAKYVNSPENPVYHKSSTLFALDRARKVIAEKDGVILVEGYFDVISAHQAGFENTIATCGTALTEEHLRLLKRSTKNIYLAFDWDIAGKKATLRGVEMCLQAGLNPFIIEITSGKDFDELARTDLDALKEAVKNAKNALEFFLDKFAEKSLNGSVEGEKKFLDSFFYFLRLVSRPVEVDHFLGKVAEKLNRSRGVIESEFKRVASKKTGIKPKYEVPKKIGFSREANFVGFLCAHWDFFADKIDEKLLDLFSEELPKDLLVKKSGENLLSEEEKIQLSAWEIYQENLYEENISSDILNRDFRIFVEKLKTEKAKQKRMEEAKKLRESLKR